MTLAPPLDDGLRQFGAAYAQHRAAEGRGYSEDDLLALPWLTTGPLARQWSVRARTFDAFLARIVAPMAMPGRRLNVLDLGAGNGWLSYRLALDGHACTAVDIRDDEVDGLGAAGPYLERAPFQRLTASFDALPAPDAAFDVVVFNAALHYATDLSATLAEARRVTAPGGRIVILDSPFYARGRDGEAMVAEKRAGAGATFGERAGDLLCLPFIEYLTRETLAAATPGLRWRRRRVRYPLWYELRPLSAGIRRGRRPSRFDLWSAEVA